MRPIAYILGSAIAQRARQKYRLASQKCDRAACPPEVSSSLSEVRSRSVPARSIVYPLRSAIA
ncbi:hypothetical protein [Arthrospira sp. PCC 8006]|uniref:hypothetical protein n=1 Tax=Arthrospira sp. PCC 8006 TaxID=1982224 RepID=UPI00396F40C6